MSQLPEHVLAILVCPRCRGKLSVEAAALRCDACALRYPVVEGIPNLLVDEAIAVERDRTR